MKVFVIDVTRCSGCMTCQIACKDEHCGNDWSPYAKPQPEIGQFWVKVHEFDRGRTPQIRTEFVPVMCQHCEDASCITACPDDAIYRRSDGLVIIDPAKCTGCKLCVGACPYEVIFFNEDLHIAQKCTGCAHILDRGWPIPVTRCADSCIAGALRFGEESEFNAELVSNTFVSRANGVDVLHPEYGLKPRVHYLTKDGMAPNGKRFIAGTVYDPAAKEIVEDATCTLSGDGSGNTTTDGFGDFWFDGLTVGNYTLTISAAGKTKTIEVNTEHDVSLGDIPLS